MAEDKITETAKDLFTNDPEETIIEQLPRMDGWFDVTGGQIQFLFDIEDLTKGESYLAYLTAAFVAHLAEERESAYVPHSEVNNYLGWKEDDGGSAKHYASEYSPLLNTDSGEKSIAAHRLREIIDIIERGFEND